MANASATSPLPADSTAIDDGNYAHHHPHPTHVCNFCGATFVTRNALFRHLRRRPLCHTALDRQTVKATDTLGRDDCSYGRRQSSAVDTTARAVTAASATSIAAPTNSNPTSSSSSSSADSGHRHDTVRLDVAPPLSPLPLPSLPPLLTQQSPLQSAERSADYVGKRRLRLNHLAVQFGYYQQDDYDECCQEPNEDGGHRHQHNHHCINGMDATVATTPSTINQCDDGIRNNSNKYNHGSTNDHHDHNNGNTVPNGIVVAEMIGNAFFEAVAESLGRGWPPVHDCYVSLASSSQMARSSTPTVGANGVGVGVLNHHHGSVHASDDDHFHPVYSNAITKNAHLDVMGIHYRGGRSPMEIQKLLTEQCVEQEDDKDMTGTNDDDGAKRMGRLGGITHLVQTMQRIVDAGCQELNVDRPQIVGGLHIKIVGVEMNLRPKVTDPFDAYRSCTQRTYHYLLPIRWLLDGSSDGDYDGDRDYDGKGDNNPDGRSSVEDKDEVRTWIAAMTSKKRRTSSGLSATLPAEDIQTAQRLETPQCLVKLKEALRLAEKKEIKASRGERSTVTMPSLSPSATRRFGSLAQNQHLPWHNFCDAAIDPESIAAVTTTTPSCPSDHHWKSVDRVRMGDIVYGDDTNDTVDLDDVTIAIEVRGDNFLPGQVPRIVVSAVAVSRGWLPRDFFQVATRPDVVVETPDAPPGRVYFASARYHSVEVVSGSSILSQTESNEARKWLCSLRSHLLKESQRRARVEREWLNRLQSSVCPNICAELARIVPVVVSDTDPPTTNATITQLAHEIEICAVTTNGPTIASPPMYRETLSLLRQICAGGKWPSTTGARSRFLRAPQREVRRTAATRLRGKVTKYDGHLYQCGSFLIVNPKHMDERRKPPPANSAYPDLVGAIFELEEGLLASDDALQTTIGKSGVDGSRRMRREPSLCCFVSRNASFTPHLDSGKPKNGHLTVGLGEYINGGLIVDGKKYNIHYLPLEYNGWEQVHETEPFHGERFSLTWYTPERRNDFSPPATGLGYEDSVANSLVDAHAVAMPSYPQLKFRTNSTDALVIIEILNPDQGCAYEMSSTRWRCLWKGPTAPKDEAFDGFCLKGHTSVLDVGAHIGVFSRYALTVGCKKVYAYEPETQNLILLKQNLTKKQVNETTTTTATTVTDDWEIHIHDCAVAHGDVCSTTTLVHAPNRNDGSLNTWRHSLEIYSHYAEDTDQLPILARSTVRTIPMFGPFGALQPGMTFVKMDCEGAEVDIFLSTACAIPANWLDVTHLVFEWSFTKERRVSQFHVAVQNLETAGFIVVYEGKGSWWDTDPSCIWPYYSDILVFAKRHLQQKSA